jgi:hypothetical protein
MLNFYGDNVYEMPISCVRCILEGIQRRDGDTFSEITNDFYLPIYKDCA